MKKIIVLLLILFQVALNKPQVRVSLTGAPNELSISWQSSSSSNSIVFFGYSRTALTNKVTGRIQSFSACGNYRSTTKEVILKNLQPKTKIYYQVVLSSSENDRSAIYSVNTPPSPGDMFPFTFLAYGDTDTKRSATATVLNEMIAQNNKGNMDFVYHLGDFAYDTSDTQGRWDEFFNMYEPLISSTWFQFSVGNHEALCSNKFENFVGRFTSATSRASRSNSVFWHSWDYSYVHFITVSSEHSLGSSSEQYRWVEEDLKRVDRSKTPWIVIGVHKPMYSSNVNHGSDTVLRANLEPLMERYRVDVVLAGHVHAYERTCKVLREKCFNEDESHLNSTNAYSGTLHLCLGTGGRGSYTSWRTQPAWSKRRNAIYGYAKIQVTKTSFNVQFIQMGGSVYDTVNLSK